MAYALVPAFALALGAYAWSRYTPDNAPQVTKVVTSTEPQPGPPPPKPHVPTAAELRAAEEERIARATIEANKAAHEKQVKAQEEKARRLDREARANGDAEDLRQWNARQVAGMGYRLMEDISPTGASMGSVPVKTVTDCALSCLRDKCAGFAFPRKPPGELRSCYRFRAPLTFVANADYVGGQLSGLDPALENAAPLPVGADGPAVAQSSPPAGSSAKPAPADDLTHCPTGPVKVTGFDVVCEQLLGGGSSPGSNRERYVVPNINACAAYCRHAARCAGFSYDAAQPAGQHDCQIFGRGFIMNHGEGWISGVR